MERTRARRWVLAVALLAIALIGLDARSVPSVGASDERAAASIDDGSGAEGRDPTDLSLDEARQALTDLLDDPALAERLEEPDSAISAMQRLLDSKELDDEELAKEMAAQAASFEAEYQAAMDERDIQRAAEDVREQVDGGSSVDEATTAPTASASPEAPVASEAAAPTADAPAADVPSSGRPGDWLLADHQGVTDPKGYAALLEDYQAWLASQPTARSGTERTTLSCAGSAPVGPRHAPTTSIRPGKLYTPVTNSMANRLQQGGIWQVQGTYLAGDQAMAVRKNPVTGVDEFKVEAHVYSDPNFLYGYGRARVTVSPASRAANGQVLPSVVYDTASANSPLKVLCYAEDAGKSSVTRAYVDGWLPMPTGEPGFGVKAESISGGVLGISFFWGADQAAIGVGDRPTFHSANVPDSIGLIADTSVLVDRNGKPDDLETLMAPYVRKLVDNAMAAMLGRRNIYFCLKKKTGIKECPRQLLVKIPIDIYTLELRGGFDLDLDVEKIPGSDNEARLTAKVWVPDLFVRGKYKIHPIFWCYGRAHVSAGITVTAVINLANPEVGLGMRPKAEAEFTHFNIWGMYSSPFPALCNLWYLLGIDAFDDLLKKPIRGAIEDAVNDVVLGTALGDPSKLVTSVQVGGQGGPGASVVGGSTMIQHTCETHYRPTNPGFNGFPGRPPCWGGRVALTPDGLEVAGDLLIRDLKRYVPAPVGPPVPRRFPWVYRSTVPDFRALVADHRDATGQPFSAGVILPPHALNATIRAFVEGSAGPDPAQPGLAPNGLLDRTFTLPVFNYPARLVPTVSPVILDIPRAAGGRMINVYAPDLRLFADDGSGVNNQLEFGINYAAGSDIAVANNGSLVPNFAAAGVVTTLNCHSIIEAICKGWDTLLSATVTFVSQTFLVPMLNQAVSATRIPNDLVAGTQLANVRVQRRGLSLAVYGDVIVAPTMALTSSSTTSTYRFDAAVAGMPGTGPITYEWKVEDALDGSIEYQGTTTASSVQLPLLALRRVHLITLSNGTAYYGRMARATVTARRAGASVTASGSMFSILTA